ncbi:MAG: hypothetical protein ABMA15_02100 [Vicinamibacterales bacterium]
MSYTLTERVRYAALAIFTAGVVLVGIVYGMFVGALGPSGIDAFNNSAIRRAQARIVFSVLGAMMLAWGAVELGFLERLVRRVSPMTRAFLLSLPPRLGCSASWWVRSWSVDRTR